MAKLINIINEEDPCWKGYKQLGMKKKGNREVPNCVPESVELDESEFSPMGYAQKVVNGKLSFLAALKDSEMKAVDLLKLIRKIDKNYNPKFESVNEGHFGEIDIIAQEAKDFRDFVKEFYKEYKDFPKNKDSIKWLEGIYRGRSKMEGLERVAQGLPQTEEEPISENSLSDLEKKLKSHDWWYAYSDDNRKYKSGETNWFEITKMIKGMKGNKEAEKLWNKYVPKDFNYSFKELSETQLDEGIFKIGIKHIIPLIPTGYAPNDPKYKMDLRVLRNVLNNFYKERGYEKVILPSF